MPTDVSARAGALLRATNAFLRCDDVATLGRAVTAAAAKMFGDCRGSLVLVAPDGGADLVASIGYTTDQVAAIDVVLARGPNEILDTVIAGGEYWSDEPEAVAFRERLARWDAVAGFSLPVETAERVVGSLAITYRDTRAFDAGLRESARSLCAQAGLALELLGARDALRQSARALDDRRRTAAALLEATSRLAAITDPVLVPQTLVDAIHVATGAPTVGLALRIGLTDEFAVVAHHGASEEQLAAVAAARLTPSAFPEMVDLLAGRVPEGDARLGVAADLGIGGGAAAPLVIDGVVRGFVCFFAAEGETPFDPSSWRELGAGFASIGATALARAETAAELRGQREALASDVAERTLQLRQAIDELRRASDAKTDFLANVSHELRTPLTSILGFAELLTEGFDGPLNPRQREDLETIAANGRHLLELINDLIDISRIEADRLELRPVEVDVAVLLGEVADQLRGLAGQKGIRLIVEAADGPLTVAGDRVRLHQIVLNLVSNAVKFTPGGGIVRMVAVREAGADVLPHAVRIDVRDTGIGIAAADQERVFEKFQRIAGPEHPGTGLGLAIARELAELHGGTLDLESTVGLGSTFSLRLPTGEPPGRAA